MEVLPAVQQGKRLPLLKTDDSKLELKESETANELTKEKLLSSFHLGKFVPAHLSDPDFAEIYIPDPKTPLNLSEKHQYMYGDLIIEMYGKYKNYYKKTFNPQQITSPFTASQMIDNEQQRVWIYIDEHDCFQGPFSTIEMDHWYNSELLPLDLFIGLIDRQMCVKLSEFINSTYPFDKNPDLYHVKRNPPSGAMSVGVDKKSFRFKE